MSGGVVARQRIRGIPARRAGFDAGSGVRSGNCFKP